MSKNSRLKTVTQGTQTVTLTYDDAGRRTGLTYPNGVVTSYGYDNANRLLSINHVKTPTTIEALTYQNDAAGNRIKLTRANAAASLIPQAVTNTAFDAANEQTRFNSASTNLVYDNNGNLTSFTDASGTTTYTWNARNQLTAISGPSLSVSFVYDGLGRRTSKTINSSTTGFWYDGGDVLAELSGSTPTATYIRSLSIDEPFIRKQSSGDEYYQTDALGSTLALTDGSGTSGTTYTQEPFGKTTRNGASTNSFQYTGREEDGTGTLYYRARYYQPQLQRFIQEDQVGFSGGDPNLYAYVQNNPINATDPSGNFTVACVVGSTLFGAGLDLGLQIYDNVLSGRKVLYGAASAALRGGGKGAAAGLLCGLGPAINSLRGIGAISEASRALVPLADATQATGAVRSVAGYEIWGNAGLVGNTYNINVIGLWATEGAQGLRALSAALRAEAAATGASQISITGSAIVNQSLANLSGAAARRLGFELTHINADIILLRAFLP